MQTQWSVCVCVLTCSCRGASCGGDDEVGEGACMHVEMGKGEQVGNLEHACALVWWWVRVMGEEARRMGASGCAGEYKLVRW